VNIHDNNGFIVLFCGLYLFQAISNNIFCVILFIIVGGIIRTKFARLYTYIDKTMKKIVSVCKGYRLFERDEAEEQMNKRNAGTD